jgi:tetratricopeptide (TPR) repeat protein
LPSNVIKIKAILLLVLMFHSEAFRANDTLAIKELLDKAYDFRRKNTDSTLVLVKIAETRSKKIKYNRGLALSNKIIASALFNKGELQEAIQYSKKALELFDLYGGTQIERASTLNLIGLAHMSLGEYFMAEKFYNESRKHYIAAGDTIGESTTVHNIGVNQFYLGNYDQAMFFYMEALKMTERFNDLQSEADILSNIGIVLVQEQQFGKAISYYKRSINILNKLNDRRGMGQTLSSIGVAYYTMANYDSSYYYHKASADTFAAASMFTGVAQSISNMADILLMKGKIAEAESLYLNSLNIRRKAEEKYGLIISYNNLGKLYTEKKEWSKASLYLDSAYAIAKELNNAYMKSEVTRNRSALYASKGDFSNAYKHVLLFNELRDSAFSVERSKIINELQSRYEAEKKEKELIIQNNKIEQLQNEKNINQLRMYGLASLLVLIVIAGRLFITRQQQKHQNSLLKNENEKLLLSAQAKEAENNLMKEKAEKEKVIGELNLKKQELIQLALQISQQNDFLDTLKQNISNAEDKKASLISIKNDIENKLNLDKQREHFELNIELINQEFYTRLSERFSGLTEGDRKLCAMLRLNLSSKEIASILNISPKSVDMNRYRLRKKLNLSGEEMELSEFLNHL